MFTFRVSSAAAPCLAQEKGPYGPSLEHIEVSLYGIQADARLVVATTALLYEVGPGSGT
jgi:hypothetical protein